MVETIGITLIVLTMTLTYVLLMNAIVIFQASPEARQLAFGLAWRVNAMGQSVKEARKSEFERSADLFSKYLCVLLVNTTAFAHKFLQWFAVVLLVAFASEVVVRYFDISAGYSGMRVLGFVPVLLALGVSVLIWGTFTFLIFLAERKRRKNGEPPLDFSEDALREYFKNKD